MSYYPQTFPNSSYWALRNTILVHHDLDPTQGGSITYGVEGQAPYRVFKVNFVDVPHYDCNELKSTFQFALYETTNRIEIYVGQKPVCTTWQNGYAAIAIQNYAGTEAFIPPGRNSGSWTATEEAWRFVPDPVEMNVGFCWKTGDPMPIYNARQKVSSSYEFQNLDSFSLSVSPNPATIGDIALKASL